MDNLPQNLLFYICIPVYKAEKYIHTCIQSVLNQTYPHFKLILVDDGSPDCCGEICDSYAKQDDRITVIHQENLGQIAARQAATRFIRESTPTSPAYVICVDADDSLKSHALDCIRMQMEINPCDVLIYGFNRTQNGKILDSAVCCTYNGLVESKRELYHLVLEDDGYNSLCRKAVSVSLLSHEDYAPFFGVRLGEDLLQSLYYYRHSKKVQFIDNKLYNYEVNPNSITKSVRYENYHVDSIVRAEVLKFLREENVWNKDDYAQYFRYCRRLLYNEIERIAWFSTNRSNKDHLYDEICNDSYYAYLLHETNCKEPLLLALRGGHYGVISFYFNTRRKFGKIKASIKKAISGKSK